MSGALPSWGAGVWAVLRQELRQHLLGASGWAFLTVVLLAAGLLFLVSLATDGQASLRGMLPNLVFTLLFCVPWITMGTIAGEARRGSLALLLTAPVPLSAVVVGKWLGSLGLCGLVLVLMLPLPMLLMWIGDPDPGVLATTYLGLAACCALFCAAGVCVSAFAREPMVAGVGTLVVLLPLWLAGVAHDLAPLDVRPWLAPFSLAVHLRSFARGVLDSGDVAWFVGLTGGLLWWSWRALESRRWR